MKGNSDRATDKEVSPRRTIIGNHFLSPNGLEFFFTRDVQSSDTF
jgi:hypothetical protein